jgi:hypothetical protein
MDTSPLQLSQKFAASAPIAQEIVEVGIFQTETVLRGKKISFIN